MQPKRIRPITRGRAKQRPVELVPSHWEFAGMIHHVLRGKSNPCLESSWTDDHVAQLCDLLHDDVDGALWDRNAEKEGVAVRRALTRLTERLDKDGDLGAAETIYAIATQAAFEVMNLFLRRPALFDQIAMHRAILPAMFSIHPGTAEVMARMRTASQLGKKTNHARRVGSKSYFTSDSAPNVYARAIMASVSFNRELLPVSCQQYGRGEFDRKHAVRTVVLPFPKYVRRLARVPEELTPASVMAYWRIGKAMILEEMPEFHLQPEWKEYRDRRHYAGGAKDGAVQHAIFRDILSALKTLAGGNRRRASSVRGTRV